MTPTPPASSPSTSMNLSPQAQLVYDETMNKWSLDEIARSLLILACEAMTRADQAAKIVSEQGLCQKDRWGVQQKHPASLLERDHRAAAAASLQKLSLHLAE